MRYFILTLAAICVAWFGGVAAATAQERPPLGVVNVEKDAPRLMSRNAALQRAAFLNKIGYDVVIRDGDKVKVLRAAVYPPR